jgi:hypothetical protein
MQQSIKGILRTNSLVGVHMGASQVLNGFINHKFGIDTKVEYSTYNE